MKNVYYIVFTYNSRIFYKIGEGEATRVRDFVRQSPHGVQVLDYAVYPVAGDTTAVEKAVQRRYEKFPDVLPNTTEVFRVDDLHKLRKLIEREIANEEARCVKRNKQAPRFLQITPDSDTVDKIVEYVVGRPVAPLLLLDDRNGEVFRALVAAGFPQYLIVSLDTRNGYPAEEAMMKYDLIVMNPPFTRKGDNVYWRKFVKKALALLAEGGKLVAVLPQNTGCTWNNVLLENIKFPGAAIEGRVVVMDEGDAIVGVRTLRTSAEAFVPYGVVVKRHAQIKGRVCRALYFDKANPSSTAVVADVCPFNAGATYAVTADETLLEKIAAALKAHGFRTNINHGELLKIVKEIA